MTDRGFTLYEALLTCTLFLIVLAIIASLGREYSRVSRFSSSKQQSMLALTVGLEGVARELRGAVLISQPSPGGNNTALSFKIVDPNTEDRLWPTPPGPLRESVVDVNNAAYLTKIQYQCVTEGLQRQAWASNGTLLGTQMVAAGVVGFSAQLAADKKTALLAASVQEESIVRILTTPVLLLEGQ